MTLGVNRVTGAIVQGIGVGTWGACCVQYVASGTPQEGGSTGGIGEPGTGWENRLGPGAAYRSQV